MAKRPTAIGRHHTSHNHKTAKRLAIKEEMLATRAAKRQKR